MDGYIDTREDQQIQKAPYHMEWELKEYGLWACQSNGPCMPF
jgi:hypothetical protein